jgi:intracellular sulfur oxidation DsrE/DsrF family protein
MIKRLCNPLRRMFMAMLVLWAASTLNAVAADQPASKPAEEAIKVVYHADFADPRRFSAMLSNIHNMVSTYQSELKEYDVRIVFVSYGIRFVTQDKLTGTPFAEDSVLKQRRAELLGRLATLRDNEGVKLELCEITREAVRLPREKIIPGVALVPSGVVRIAELQHQGYAYLKVE